VMHDFIFLRRKEMRDLLTSISLLTSSAFSLLFSLYASRTSLYSFSFSEVKLSRQNHMSATEIFSGVSCSS
jgi:hypothetical protein